MFSPCLCIGNQARTSDHTRTCSFQVLPLVLQPGWVSFTLGKIKTWFSSNFYLIVLSEVITISCQQWVVKTIKLAELDYLSETVILVFCKVKGVPWCVGHWACFDSEGKIADYNFAPLSQVRCVSHFISGLGCVNQNSNTMFCLVFNEVLIKQGNLMSSYQSWIR